MKKEQLHFNVGPVTERSMPFWCVANPLGDPFGAPVLKPIEPVNVCELICYAAEKGLIEMTSAHDDDLVPWDSERPDVLTSKDKRQLGRLLSMLNNAGVGFNTITCNLHANPIFRDGGLTNPNPDIRNLALRKVKRTLLIGRILDASHFTYWVARDGFEVAVKVPWEHVYGWIIEGLNSVWGYVKENHFGNYLSGTIEPKPNEPRGHMFIPTSGHAVGLISKLEKPAFWKVNPELTQHEGMTLLDPVSCVAYLVSLNKLGFLHFGNQINGQFDNDFPPLIGPEHLKETAQMFWVLRKMGWEGVVEFDCHMLRCEGESGSNKCRMQFIEDCSMGLSIALLLADRLNYLPNFAKEASHSQADLMSAVWMCNLDQGMVRNMTHKER